MKIGEHLREEWNDGYLKGCIRKQESYEERIAELEAQLPEVVKPKFNCGDYDCPECEFRSLYRLWKFCPQCGAKLNWDEK